MTFDFFFVTNMHLDLRRHISLFLDLCFISFTFCAWFFRGSWSTRFYYCLFFQEFKYIGDTPPFSPFSLEHKDHIFFYLFSLFFFDKKTRILRVSWWLVFGPRKPLGSHHGYKKKKKIFFWIYLICWMWIPPRMHVIKDFWYLYIFLIILN